MKLKMINAYLKFKYNSYDTFELESKQGREAGKFRRYASWFFMWIGLAILFGENGYELKVNGRIMPTKATRP